MGVSVSGELTVFLSWPRLGAIVHRNAEKDYCIEQVRSLIG